jgi:hypothetical protein
VTEASDRVPQQSTNTADVGQQIRVFDEAHAR